MSLTVWGAELETVARRGGSRRAVRRRPEALLEVRGQGVERRVSRVQSCGEPAFGRDEAGVASQPARQRRAGLVLGRQCGRRRRRRRRPHDEKPPRRGRSAAGSAGRRCQRRHRPGWRSLGLGHPHRRQQTLPWPPRATRRCCVARRRAHHARRGPASLAPLVSRIVSGRRCARSDLRPRALLADGSGTNIGEKALHFGTVRRLRRSLRAFTR
jgi:hypothetical protein